MDFNIKITLLFFGILLTGLTAGLCFTWSNAVTKGIAKLDDLTYLQSFQSMNRVIINPSFLLVFFLPAVLLLLNAYLYRGAPPISFWPFLLAGILYFLGIGLVTIFGNVPLNEVLDAAVLESLSLSELKKLRTYFEQPWNRWHNLRTLASTISFTLQIIGLIYLK